MKFDESNIKRVVVDTNILVSGFGKQITPPVQVIDAWHRNQFILLTSPRLINETQLVLERSVIQASFSVSDQQIDRFLKQLRRKSVVTPGRIEVDAIRNDPSDNMILSCALEGRANYIVTGDKKHLLPLKEYEGIQIVTAREFVDILQR